MSRIRKFIARYPSYRRIQRRYRKYTMVKKRDYIDNLFLVDFWRRKEGRPRGCVVECGTWRGGMFFGMMDVCPDVEEFHGFDSFAGLPPADEIDGDFAVRQQRNGALNANNNTASREEFDEALRRFQEHRLHQVTVHQGWFEDTLRDFEPKLPISVLRLDGDWYASTIVVLEHLYDYVLDDGLILIDDYRHWDGCSRAVHDFLSKRQSRDKIRTSWWRGITHIVKGRPRSLPRQNV